MRLRLLPRMTSPRTALPIVAVIAASFTLLQCETDGTDLTDDREPLPERASEVAKRELDQAPVRVLYVASIPTWHYRYVKNALKRDPDLEVQTFLIYASPNFSHDRSEGLPMLSDLPRSDQEFASYDVIFIDDVPPEKLAETERERELFLARLVAFVGNGGGVGFLAGPRAMPDAYRVTSIETLLPVVLERSPVTYVNETKSFGLEVTSFDNPVVNLTADPVANRRLWHEEFPDLFGHYATRGPRPGAEVLLRRRDNQRIIAAIGSHGRGRTFFLATDETWRWRKPRGGAYFDLFWKKVVLALRRSR